MDPSRPHGPPTYEHRLGGGRGDEACRLGRVHADERAALPTRRDRHVSADPEREPSRPPGVVQHSYTAPGSGHRILELDSFYEMEVNGVTLVDWVDALIAGEPLDDVHCEQCETA
jgi:hypothetical protein